jgi:hypothetical protein
LILLLFCFRDYTDWLKYEPKSKETDGLKTDSLTGVTTFKKSPYLQLPATFKLASRPKGSVSLLDEKPNTSGSMRIRYSKEPKEPVISKTQSEPSFEVARKWKEDCQCLRCQMLKREFKEGDSHYGLWGRYPCHRVDPTVMLDD